jgi:hypothetical protein
MELVWEALATFDFESPDAELQPATGVTGLDTYAVVTPPEPVVERLTSPGTGALVEVEFAVATVTIDWGDGRPETVPPLIYDLFGPYPEGEITHMYETKGAYDVSIAYDWRVRWRVDAGPWEPVNDIDPTVWATSYQVDEIVTRVTG